ncbi:MAG: serine/threonine-protein kinase, partial [Polyangiaceae bacterium]
PTEESPPSEPSGEADGDAKKPPASAGTSAETTATDAAAEAPADEEVGEPGPGGEARPGIVDELTAPSAGIGSIGSSELEDTGRLDAAHPSAEAPPPRGRLASWASAHETSSVMRIDDEDSSDTDGDDHEPDPLIGMVIAERYRIIERIGRGGMGIVYRVEHVRIGKLLAMKLLAGELSHNKEVVRRFKQEALTVSKLSSPYTVQVFDYGVWQHLTYLVMELVSGDDLGRLLRRGGPMPFARVGRLMLQVCASLAEAHSKGIVHRDIKPENIMVLPEVDGREVAKVVDFGLAKLRETPELNDVTLQGSVVGTPYYISPEQVLGEDVDGRSDLYSVGAVMFRSLTGKYPFEANSPIAMFTKHLTEAPPSAVDREPELGIPHAVSQAIAKCMAKDPAERFQNIEQLRDLIVSELDGAEMSKAERMWLGLDSGQERVQAVADVTRTGLYGHQVATREELESYERKLRRTRYGAYATFLVLLVAVVGGGVLYGLQRSAVAFTGFEKEPNNTRAQPNELPLARAIRGRLGKRLDPTTSDRDFYRFVVPGRPSDVSHIRLMASALPNIATCSLLFRAGYRDAVARYCVGRPAQELLVPATRLATGEYYLAVVQDMSSSGGKPLVHENVSDMYRVRVEQIEPGPSDEVEPNDGERMAQRVAGGAEVVGTLGWRGDEDTYCAPSRLDRPVRWSLSDAGRPPGTVIEMTPLASGVPGPVMRVHGAKSKPFGRMRLAADVNSPYVSPPYPVEHGERCVRLRLTNDPWVRGDAKFTLHPDGSRYRLKLLVAEP